jgi:serine/threonine protein kinase
VQVSGLVPGTGLIDTNLPYLDDHDSAYVTGGLSPRNDGLPEEFLSFYGKAGHWSGRGRHAEFLRDETIPLTEHGFLGRGAFGDVHKVKTIGPSIEMARKQIYCNRRITMTEVKNEVAILEKLRHRHVINLVGSFTHRKTLGLLLLPVAVCDLGDFLEELDNPEQCSKLVCADLGLDVNLRDTGLPTDPLLRLQRLFGCISSAVKYLHDVMVKHKDLKPRNVLLTKDSVFLTDFGLSKDMSGASHSLTSGFDVGTFRYAAPEVAGFRPHGRAADVFSLGCIFMEMITVMAGMPLADLESARHNGYGDNSYHSNRESLVDWMLKSTMQSAVIRKDMDVDCAQRLLGLSSRMMSLDPNHRPSINEIQEELGEITQARDAMYGLYGTCCWVYCPFKKLQRRKALNSPRTPLSPKPIGP